MSALKTHIAKVATGTALSFEEAREAFDIIMSGDATPGQIGGFLMALRVRGDALQAHTGVEVSQIGPASRLVERLTHYPVPPNKAIVGSNAFAHEAGIHQDGLLKDVATYQIIDPDELGLAMTLPLGKHSGRHAFSRACAEAGLSLDEDELILAFARFKARADEGGVVSIHELVQEVTLS